MLDIAGIQAVLPHRYPFLLVDRILELDKGRRAVGIKCVSANEPFFEGHFPGRPVMPGVLVVEAMAQVGAVALLSMEEHRGRIALFAGIDSMRFRRMVVPGDVLKMEVEVLKTRSNVGKAHCRATVEGEVSAEGVIMFALDGQELVEES
ncbi:MAG: 3-hydroxyacyl-ACP dehydratase FabZ [Bacillota bacterium]